MGEGARAPSTSGAASVPAPAPASNEEDIWGQILTEAARKTKDVGAVEKGTVLVLGDRSSGKSSLINRMQQADQPDGASKGVALGYAYIDVYEDENDDPVGTIDLWQLKGEAHTDLLNFALNAKTIQNAVVLICLDFSQPWSLSESLRKWLGVLTQHLQSIQADVPKALEDRLRVLFQTYAEPSTSEGQSKKKKKKVVNPTSEDVSLLPSLDPNILSSNLGVPIYVVCCKCDSVATLEHDFDFRDPMFEYIQQHLRRMCLAYGAGLIYTSARKDVNCSVLLDILEQRLFHFDLKHRAQLLISSSSTADATPHTATVPSPSSSGSSGGAKAAETGNSPALFVPIGWDSLAKINMDFQNQNLTKDPDEPFENVLKKPLNLKRREQAAAPALQAEDDFEFLSRHKASIERDDKETKDDDTKQGGLLQTFKKMGGGIIAGDTNAADDTISATGSSSSGSISSSSSGAGAAPTPAGDKPTPGGIGNAPAPEILASFFSGLMKDRPGVKREASKAALMTGTSSKDKTRLDAEKELERMKKAVPKK